MSKIICYCKNISELQIEDTISKGAKTLKDIQQMLGVCCSIEINKMIKKDDSIYSKCACCQ